jgi:carbon monoxide dehydrogenase subunit G
MSDYKSPLTPVKASNTEVFQFLGNFNNFENLMPKEQVTNWQSTEDSCSFTVQGMGELGLMISEKIPESKIVIVPDAGKPLPIKFNLVCEMKALAEKETEVLIRIDADLPPMIALMAGRPLQNLVNILAQRLQEYYAAKPQA